MVKSSRRYFSSFNSFLLSTLNCLLSTDYCLLSTFYCLLSTVYCLLSIVCCLLSTEERRTDKQKLKSLLEASPSLVRQKFQNGIPLANFLLIIRNFRNTAQTSKSSSYDNSSPAQTFLNLYNLMQTILQVPTLAKIVLIGTNSIAIKLHKHIY